MSKSKYKWCTDGIVFNEDCTKVIADGSAT